MLTYTIEKWLLYFFLSSSMGHWWFWYREFVCRTLSISGLPLSDLQLSYCLIKIYMIRQMINAFFIRAFPVIKSLQ